MTVVLSCLECEMCGSHISFRLQTFVKGFHVLEVLAGMFLFFSLSNSLSTLLVASRTHLGNFVFPDIGVNSDGETNISVNTTPKLEVQQQSCNEGPSNAACKDGPTQSPRLFHPCSEDGSDPLDQRPPTPATKHHALRKCMNQKCGVSRHQ